MTTLASTSEAPRAAAVIPRSDASSDDFISLRALLRDADYTAPAVCERLSIASIYEFRPLREGRTTGRDIGDRLDLFIRLFLDAEAVDGGDVRAHLAPAELALLERVRLLGVAPGTPERWCATVLFYPVESLHIASDIPQTMEEAARAPIADIVYPAISLNTGVFLTGLPQSPCERFLELCAGTGIAALAAASRYATHAWAADIADRATRFAEFNARLNELSNVTIVQGDLYAPFAGQQFDRIVAHPPYVASTAPRFVYREAGLDGEEVTRRIIAGLPAHLAPGGAFYATFTATDRRGAPLERRIREMLGDAAPEFDVLVAAADVFEPTLHYCRLAINGRTTFGEVEALHRAFTEQRIESFAYVSVALHRHERPRPAATVRRFRGARATGQDFDELLRWQAATLEPESWRRVLRTRPHLAPDAVLQVVHHPGAAGWEPAGWRVARESPFSASAECTAELADLLVRFDGRSTVGEHLVELRDGGALPAATSDEEIARLVQSFISAGLLCLPREEGVSKM